MPSFLVEKALKKYNNGKPLPYYEGGVFAQEDNLNAQKMADCLGVSYSAFVNRLKELQLLECHSMDEYIKKLQFGGAL